MGVGRVAPRAPLMPLGVSCHRDACELFLILLALFLATVAFAAGTNAPADKIIPPPPAREFRAAWIATVANIDWPSKPGLPVAQQQAELVGLLDRAAQLHFNAVFFQVRSVSDAMYPSAIEPWTEYLTGVQGRAPQPFYDPLAFAITEAHKRGMQLHAWFNPFRAGHPEAKSPPAPNHISRTMPALVRHYAEQIWLDPGEPMVQARAEAVVMDVVKRYDVDGIVLDDYFYPYPEKNSAGVYLDFPDDASWKRYGLGTGMSRGDWRRDNVNRVVYRLSQSIKAAKPWVLFGVSSFGIWRPKQPPQIAGMDAYQRIYADARRWLADGWVDYLAPQLYWASASSSQSFPVLFDWWSAQNLKNRHLWPGLADAYVGTHFPAEEISRQIQIIRTKNDPGAVHYHLRTLLENPALTTGVYAQYSPPALVPTTPWINATSPPPPKLTASTYEKSAHIQWQNGAGKPAFWWLLQVRANGQWTTQVFPGPRSDCYFDSLVPDAIALRSVDRLGNMSQPTIFVPRRYTTSAIPHGGEKIRPGK